MQPAFNPFRQTMMMPQQTGFMQPQMTGFPGGFPSQQQQQQQPFLQPQQTGAMAFGNPQPQMFPPPQQQQQQPPMFQPTPQQPFMQPNQTGFPGGMQSQQPGFLQPHATGANPFRQSTMINTNTGTLGGPFSQPSSPFHQTASPSFGQQIQRPGSTPAGAQAKPLVSQPTGSKNPFAPSPGSQAAKAATVTSRGPTMNELAMGFGRDTSPAQSQAQSPWATVNGKPSSNGTGLGDVASSFVFDSKKESNAADDFMAQFGGLSVNTSTTNASGPTSTTSPTGTSQLNAFGSSQGPSSPSSSQFLQPQQTGFGGSAVKPFKPTSSFGSQLFDGLPPVSSPHSTSPGVGASPNAPSGGVQSQSTGFPGMGAQATGGAQGMQNQQTGLNQFGSGAFSGGMGGGGTMGSQQTGLPNPFRPGSISSPSPGGMGMPFGANPIGQQGGGGGGAFGANSPFAGQNRMPQQNQNQGGFGGGGGSLI